MVNIFSFSDNFIELAFLRKQFLVQLFFLFRQIPCFGLHCYMVGPDHHHPKECEEDSIENATSRAELLLCICQIKTLMPNAEIKCQEILPDE